MKRSQLFTIFIIIICVVFVGRLFYLQVLDNSYNSNPLNNSTVKVIYDYPERGFVYDRNGVLMVANQLSYDIMIIPNEVKSLDTLEFCKMLKINKNDFIKRFNKSKNYSPYIASTFLIQLSKTDFAYLQEKMYKYRGFYIQKRLLREYPMNSASNVLGYISEVKEQIIKENPYYQLGELIGTAGVEKTYENILRGQKGVKFIQRDRFNKDIGSYKDGIFDTLPIPGKDIVLTIDSKLQKYGEDLMVNKRGGIVAIEPSTGEILALITAPSYNPNLMVGRERSKNFTKLYLDDVSRPLFDRGLQAQYPPGSPFKIITALNALQENAVDTKTTIKCYGGYRYGLRKGAFMECHCGTFGSPVNLNKAIYRSCNSYFANAYRKTLEKPKSIKEGVDIWSNHAKSFGLGNYLNNDLSVGQKGLIPNSNYYDKWYPDVRWTSTYIISNAIGQGEILATPIQLANMTATVANRGYFFTPHIVKNIDNQKLDDKFTTKKYTTIDAEHFEPVVEGLFNVLEHPRGTASWSKVKGIEICGKTGTSENPHGQDHSVFIAFAPKDNPKIAIAVYVENGYWGSRWAGPIASLMIEKYLNGSVSKSWQEERMLNGSLEDEYAKQLTKTNKIEKTEK